MESIEPTPPPEVLFQHVMLAAKLLSPSRGKHAIERGPWREVRRWILAEYGQDSSVFLGYELIDDPWQAIDGDKRECVSDALVTLLERLRPYLMPDG